MKIKYFGYNSFIIQSKEYKIAFDPGGQLYFPRWLNTIIPEAEWKNITHIFVTHGDPDHYWHADRVAKASNSPIICNKSMVREINSKKLFLGPRSKGLTFNETVKKYYTVSPEEVIKVDEIKITGIQTTHGNLQFKIGPFSKSMNPGDKDRIGWGSIGFHINLNNNTIVNLGDTLLLDKKWRMINEPDVLMLPIGGPPTMNEREALEAVKIIKPKLVIPCHYNCPALLNKCANPANVEYLENEVKKLGYNFIILKPGENVDIC